MKNYPLLFTILLLVGSSYQTTLADNLCEQKEKALFSCKIEKSEKSVSLCQSDTDPEKIVYKYGTAGHVEMTLPTKDSGKPFTCFERFGRGSTQWLQEITFPNKDIAYVLSTPQGISVSLSIRSNRLSSKKSAVFMWCDSGPNGDAYRGSDINDAIDILKGLRYPEKKCLSSK